MLATTATGKDPASLSSNDPVEMGVVPKPPSSSSPSDLRHRVSAAASSDPVESGFTVFDQEEAPFHAISHRTVLVHSSMQTPQDNEFQTMITGDVVSKSEADKALAAKDKEIVELKADAAGKLKEAKNKIHCGDCCWGCCLGILFAGWLAGQALEGPAKQHYR